VLGSGPSLDTADVELASDAAVRLLAISDSYKIATSADVIFSPDARWWDWHQDAVDARCSGQRALRYSLERTSYNGVVQLARGHKTAIERDPRFLATGGHGGYSAINLAVHLGAARIVLLGYDMQPDAQGVNHFFGEHPNNSHVRYERWLPLYADLPRQLHALGVTIVNATRRTAITGIERVSLEEALC